MISRLLCWLGLHRWVTDRPYFLALKPSETPAICSRCHLTRNGYHQAARLAAVKADYDAEIDRLRACRDELRDVTEAMDDPTINNTRTLVEAVRDLRLQRDSWRREAELNAEAADQSVTYARQLAFARRKIEAAQESVQRLLEKGKGTWPGTDYIRDDTWHYWRGEDAGLRQALCIIDGAMQRSKR